MTELCQNSIPNVFYRSMIIDLRHVIWYNFNEITPLVFGDVKMLRKFVWYYPSETFFYRCPHSEIWKAPKAIHTCYCWHDIYSKLLLERHHRIFANHRKDYSYQQSVEAATALAVCLMCFICVLWSRLSQPEQRKQSSRAKIESAQVELHLQ